jgi:hypothetical protein
MLAIEKLSGFFTKYCSLKSFIGVSYDPKKHQKKVKTWPMVKEEIAD